MKIFVSQYFETNPNHILGLKNPAYSYTWFHRKLTYSYTVLWIYIPFHIFCYWLWGGGTLDNFGMGVGVSILIPIPVIYPAFEKKAYSYTWFYRKLTYSYTVLWIHVPFHNLKCTNDPHHEKPCFIKMWKKASQVSGFIVQGLMKRR